MIDGKIYLLTFGDGTTYVGSTKKKYLSQRVGQHKFNPVSVNGFSPLATQKINSGIGFNQEILKEDIFFNDYDLLYWERIYTELTDNTINKRRCWRTTEEMEKQIKDTKRESDKKYRESHKDKLKEFKGKKILCPDCGNYYTHSNKQKHLKSSYHINKIIKPEKTQCEDCGFFYAPSNLRRHLLSKNHIENCRKCS